jgi:Leucine-rich repeat (LRR) protein
MHVISLDVLFLLNQALNYLPNLEECYAAGNRLKTIDLSRCKKLQDVDISKNRITDLSGLKTLSNLQVWMTYLPFNAEL